TSFSPSAVVAPLSRGVTMRAAATARDDESTFSHWPRAKRLLKSCRALAGPTSANRGRGNLRALHRDHRRDPFFSRHPVSFGRLATGTKLPGLSRTRGPQDSDSLRPG